LVHDASHNPRKAVSESKIKSESKSKIESTNAVVVTPGSSS
jgi:hypothetical protein